MREWLPLALEQVLARATTNPVFSFVFSQVLDLAGSVTGSGEACLVLERWFCECLKWLGYQENTMVFTSFGSSSDQHQLSASNGCMYMGIRNFPVWVSSQLLELAAW